MVAAALLRPLLLLLATGLRGGLTQQQPPLLVRSLPPSIKWLSFYDLNATQQHGWSNIGQSTHADHLAAAWAEYKMPGMLDVEDLPGKSCGARGCFKDGLYHREWSNKSRLRSNWQQILESAINSSKQALDSGAIRGFFLGDEVCCAGVTVAEIGLVAAFIKARVPPHVFTYLNECAHTFNRSEMVRRGMPASSMSQGDLLGGKLPAALDYISFDEYGNSSSSAGEVVAVRRLHQQWVFPVLSPHQRVFVVPGFFSDATPDLPKATQVQQDEALVTKLEQYLRYAAEESRIEGIMPWHWKTWPVGSLPQKIRLGAGDSPKLVARLRQLRVQNPPLLRLKTMSRAVTTGVHSSAHEPQPRVNIKSDDVTAAAAAAAVVTVPSGDNFDPLSLRGSKVSGHSCF